MKSMYIFEIFFAIKTFAVIAFYILLCLSSPAALYFSFADKSAEPVAFLVNKNLVVKLKVVLRE